MVGRTTFACPGCGRSIGVPEKLLGRWIECPHCGMGFAAMTDSPESSPSVSDYQPSHRPPAALFGYLLLVVLALATCIVIALVASRRKPETAKGPASVESVAPRANDFNIEETVRASSAAATFLVWMVVLSVIGIAYLVATILMLAWVARDARNRGIDGGAMWVIVILFTHWIGLLVYLASRPHGMLVTCGTCHNKRLNYSKACPHCGNA